MSIPELRIRKGEDRRIRLGHPWIFSNEVNTKLTPLKNFTPGTEVIVTAHDGTVFGVAYINPHSLISARLFSRHPEVRLNLEFFKQRLQVALALRTQLFAKPYYRLVFSEADELPGLVIDRFDQDFVMQVNTAGMEQRTALIVEALCAVIPTTRSILLRNDSSAREQEGLSLAVTPAFGTPPTKVELEENSVRFSVSLSQGQKTGWFYDHRLNRARLRSYVQACSVLDVFSYAGGFGIQAAVFGAKQVTCVEASATASELIYQNATLNQVADKLNVITGDAFDALKALLREQRQFEVIILDPPAFVKRAKDYKEGIIAYQRINELAFRLLAPNGILVSCSCSMHVSMQDLQQLTQRAAHRAQSTIQLLERGHQGPDHPIHFSIPETDYLKALFVRKI